jgi:hypothetical protein
LADLLHHILLRAVAVAAISAASLTIYLVALRFVVWDLVPAAAVSHARWWQRHAPSFLRTSLVITVAALVGLGVLSIVR